MGTGGKVDAGRAETLRIELEDASVRSRWVGVLGLLSGAMQQWHFVGLVGDAVRYDSPTFAAPFSWGRLPLGRTMPPQEEWAPGMGQALDELRAEIAADGWVETGLGDQPWQQQYRHPRTK